MNSNVTIVTPAYFIISGFSGIPHVNYYYLFLLVLYIMSVVENTVVMALICFDQSLKTPKYIAVFNLAFVDVLGNSALVPKVIDTFWFNNKYISYSHCLTYLFFYCLNLLMQSLNLALLSFDRLIAIAFPFRYHIIVSLKTMFSLVATCWIIAILFTFVLVGFLTRLSYCRSVVINSYFCDHGPLYRLACNDNQPNFIIAKVLPALILWVPLMFVLISYTCIGTTLAKIAGAQDRMKAFKTCSAHIILVAIYYLPILFTFTFDTQMPRNARIISLSLAAVLPPALNPLIYVLQTQEIKQSLKMVLAKLKHSKIAVKLIIHM
ncbi:olfactory receptor 6C70-like [Gadus chalcogrammus]|uniref:olfactory receptor 6C70-like n=1 Tax=Gadus chalcogrammus TaxID=1042646 RepID=UPI0024C49F35|nr:olfactory receptor 6C70-like [Gadus chalcogrammus]